MHGQNPPRAKHIAEAANCKHTWGRGPCPLCLEAEVLAAGGLSQSLREHQTSVLGVLLSGIKAHHMETTQAGRDAGIIWPHHSTHKETEVQRDKGICPR